MTVAPTAYYDQENGGRIPIFTPTWDEFKDFKAFVESIEEYGKQSGIVKIIPPKEWKNQLPKLQQHQINNIKVTKPITQHIIGGRGVFTQTNIEDRKEYTLQQWYEICQKDQHRPLLRTNHQHNQHKRQLHHMSFDSETSNLTVDQYKEIERNYWRNITFNQPMYGADLLGTLFDSSMTSWNPNTLDNTLNKLSQTLPGVNSPYLYFGMWKATFAWHVEDMDLYSINYIHFGAPKQWYVIQPCHQKRFETFMQTTFFSQYKSCHEFLRHKTFIVSPTVLENNNIPVQRCVQQAGEFIITYPFGYHSGYNLDFNCAESVNFAMDSWLEIGRKAKPCTCIDDSVVIDVNSLFDGVLNSTIDHSTTTDTTANKRKFSEITQEENACVLCSNPLLDNHHHRHGETLLATNENSHHKHIHKVCAESVDETYIVKNLVHGIDDIPASRWKLVCVYCKKKEGACMQCCYGRCWKAFHATCAIQHDATMKRIHSDASTPHSLYDGYCPQHDPKRIDEKKRLKEAQIKEMAKKFQVGLEVLMKWRGGGMYAGTVSECLPDQKMCRVLLTDGSVRKVSWRDIV
ncbi:JmjC domain, hydroxylase-domain-containing protein [Mucor lusitanicus]|uniref:[histone H3]-trimethyl-L-lysine(9) demethylase n=1 Tax=Mucor circinelloides f. lusitanicus TaxID=29924 RepID=A0A8H4BQL0_MUCCL|nr:JmjC domain, hydroxylase-domain-containing protein [Mucor lusitanicus]